MGWKVNLTVSQQRREFITEYQRGEESLTALCRHYQICRATGYKWITRFEQEGPAGLEDRSRAPLHHPQAMADEIRKAILALKAQHPFWGAAKLLGRLEQHQPERRWPAPSTVGALLQREGLTVARRRRRRAEPRSHPLAVADEANRVWSVDFKGWFRTGDGQRCEPLTLLDNYSRYLLRCQIVAGETAAAVKPVLEAAFREYGLPERIRSDNGPPFGANGVAGLTGLTVWWIKLGIVPEKIHPGCPQQNARQERMHGTLQRETASPPAANRRQQQRRFDAFRVEYNEQRPHEALGQQPPAQFYQTSPRPLPRRLPEIEYPASWEHRTVFNGGQFCWRGEYLFASHALEGERIGLEPAAEGSWRVWFADWELGLLDARGERLCSTREWKRRQAKRSGRHGVDNR